MTRVGPVRQRQGLPGAHMFDRLEGTEVSGAQRGKNGRGLRLNTLLYTPFPVGVTL